MGPYRRSSDDTGQDLSAAAGSSVSRLWQPTYTIIHRPPPFLDGYDRLSGELLPNHRHHPSRTSSHAGPM